MSNMFMGVDINNHNAVIRKVFIDFIKNTVFLGVVAIIIAFIMNGLGWRLFGLILACVLLIPIAFNILKYVIFEIPLMIFATGIYIWEKLKRRSIQGAFAKHVLFPFIGNMIQLLENICGLIIIGYLYHAYFQKDLFGLLGYIGLL